MLVCWIHALLKCVTTSKITSRCPLACPQGTADGADAFARMSSFIVGDVAEQQRVAVIELRAVDPLPRGVSVVDEFPIESAVSALLCGNAIERHHLIAERNAKILQQKTISGACRIRLFKRILCIHARRPRNVCDRACHIPVDSYRYGNRHRYPP